MGFCTITYHQFGEANEICLGENKNPSAQVHIPAGPPGCENYVLRNADSYLRWEFAIQYESPGENPCNVASLHVQARNVASEVALEPLYIDAKDNEGLVLETFKLDIDSIAANKNCESASFSCGDPAGPWGSPLPQN